MSHHGWEITVIAPRSWKTSTRCVEVEAESSGEIELIAKEVSGGHLRKYTYIGLEATLSDLQARLVLVDSDPASRLAVQVGKWCRRNGSMLFCSTCENLSLALIDTLRREGMNGVLPWMMKRLLHRQSRNLVRHVFTNSNAGTKIFRDLGFQSVSKIPLGFDPMLFRIDEDMRIAKRRELNLEGTVLAYFGRTVPEKGFTSSSRR